MFRLKNKLCIGCILLFVGLSSSCEKDVKIPLPFDGYKMVLNAILNNDSIVYARITRAEPNENNTRSFLEVENCKTDLYENDIFKETLILKTINDKKYYVSNSFVKAGNKYTIKAALTGEGLIRDLPDIEGSDVIPVKPAFEPLEYWQSSGGSGTASQYKVSVKLKDVAGVKNFYRFRMFPAAYNTKTGKYDTYKNTGYYFSIDNFQQQGGIFGGLIDNYYRTFYFNDETFEGKEITLTISVDPYSTGMAADFKYIAPEISSLSRAAYLYFDSEKKQRDNEGNPFAETVIVYNNIQNGYGIVGSVADSTAIIRRRN